MPHSVEKIKATIGEIFIEHKNKALLPEELLDLVGRKLNNGEIDDELIQMTINKMVEEFELMQQPGGKIVPYQFP